MPERRSTIPEPNPSGLCMCGCGEATKLARQTHSAMGWVKGKPLKFVAGHQRRKSPVPYIVNPETGCWEWQRTTNGKGYGRMSDGRGNMVYAHRVYWMRENGDIPDGMEIDHVCRNRGCVNPGHLRAIPIAENRYTGPRLSKHEVAALMETINGLPVSQSPGIAGVVPVEPFSLGRNHYTVNDRGCWVWSRTVGAQGYGLMFRGDRNHLAHRVYWQHANGEIPDGLFVDHLCGERRCVNPSHMELVSQAENNRRGKAARLTMERAALIRELAPRSNNTQLAGMFGVSTKTIASVLSGVAWSNG